MSILNERQFTIDLNRFVRKIEKEDIEQFIRRILLDLLTATIKGTPVDTGRLRHNWTVSIGKPHEGWEEDYDKQGEATINAGLQAIVAQSKTDPYVLYFIVNNVEYCVYVEYGTDRMAPRLMMNKAFDAIKAKYGK